jgi:hypothetical protein
MVAQSQIEQHIENTRAHISNIVDELSNTVQRRIDWKEKVRENPTNALLLAAGAGFVFASISTPLGKSFLRIGTKSAIAALGAYMSRQGMNFVMDRIKSR